MDLEDWLKKHLLATDRVVIESTTNAWHVYDLLKPLVAEVLVANPIKVKQIACARVKTDKKDTFILARLLRRTWCRRYGYRQSTLESCGS